MATALAPIVYGSPEWLEERRQYIGASETPMVCGESPYGGPLTLVRRKLGLDEVEQTHAMVRGHLYESAICEEFAVLHPEVTLQPAWTRSHALADWLRATPDRIIRVRADMGILEAKLVHPSQRDMYGESGSEDLPYDKLIQAQTQMLVWNLPFAYVVVNFGFETREYYVPADRDIQEMIFDLSRALWHDHVLTGVLPAPDVSVDTYEAIQRTLNKRSDNVIVADADLAALVAEFGAVKGAKKAAEEREDELKSLLGVAIGHEYGIDAGTGGRVLWPQSEGKTSFDHAGLIRTLNVPEDVVQQFTRVGQPYRSMRYYAPKRIK